MKALDWQKYLDEQRLGHGKDLFTATELANVAGTSLHALNVELARLIRRGIITRYARGVYGQPHGVTPEQIIQAVDPHAYLTSASALFRHGLITQVSAVHTCFTDRRHNRARQRMTPLGRILLVCVRKPVYHLPVHGVVAPPEQALFDYVYLMRRAGVEPLSTVTFRRLETLRKSVIVRVSGNYPELVQQHVRRILEKQP